MGSKMGSFVIRSLKPHMEVVQNACGHTALVVEMLIRPDASQITVKHGLLSHLLLCCNYLWPKSNNLIGIHTITNLV